MKRSTYCMWQMFTTSCHSTAIAETFH